MISKTFRLFVSSTFSDLIEERNILQNEVFPEIKSFCKFYGYNFEPIDLRWGVSGEAGLDHKAMEICINEVEKVFNYPKPNFLIMLGNRYGWIPAQTEIEDKYFEELLELTTKDEKELLNKWYKKDENSIPSKYILQPIDKILKNQKEFDEIWFNKDEKDIVRISTKYQNIFPEDFYIGKSATEQEIIKGVLNSAKRLQSEEESVLCMVRNISNIEQVNNLSFLEDDQSKLNNLKERLKNCTKPNVEYKELNAKLVKKENLFKPDKDYLEDYAIEVKSFLKDKIKREIDRLSDKNHELEDKIHEKFKNERSKIFIGREDVLKQVHEYLADSAKKPFVLYGESGVGKSAFMAKLIKSIEENLYENTDLIYRFVGISEISSQPKLFLDDLIVEIGKKFHYASENNSKDYSESINRFVSILHQYSKSSNKKLILVIDALDQFETKSNLEWIESQLPENIKIIVSTLPSEYGEYFEILKTKVNSNFMYEIEKLNLENAKLIVKSWLKSNNKKLTNNQLEHILEMFKNNGLPLYLKIIFDQALTWKSYDDSYKDLNDNTLIESIRSFFDSLIIKKHHPKVLVNHTLGYISASKNGLSENEIVEILSSDYIVMKDIANPYHKLPSNSVSDKFPAAVWSRLYYDLLKYFSFVEFDGLSLISFYHRKIKECSKDYYYFLNKNFYHINLLEYFWNQPTVYTESKEVNLRKLSELPYHCILTDSFSKFIELYTLDFMDIKIKNGHKELLLDDILNVLNRIIYSSEIRNEVKEELVYKISFNLITYLLKKVRSTTSEIIAVEDIHAKFMFQSDISFYNKFLKIATDTNYFPQNDDISKSYLSAFKSRKANLLRRDAKLSEANKIYFEIINNGDIETLHNLEQSTIYYDVGTIAYLKGDPQNAVKYMQKSIEVAGDMNNKVSKYMSLVKLGQIRFTYYDEYDYFESILNEAFQHFWKFRFESFSARRFVRGNYGLYFDLYYAKKDLNKTKEFFEKFKNDNTAVYRSINFISSDEKAIKESACSGYSPYEARIKILENKFEEAADIFSRYLNIYIKEEDKKTLEFIAKEYYDYLLALKNSNQIEKLKIEKEKALELEDEPLNKIWKEKIRKEFI